MTIELLKNKLPDYAKDTRLNLTRVLAADGTDGLEAKQIFLIALASAYTLKQAEIVDAIIAHAEDVLTVTDIEAAKAASTIMAMNNIYYRFIHLVSDKEYLKLPANLRMNVLADPGIEKVDFELMSLAVSALTGCGMCIDAHVQTLVKDGVTKQGIQSSIRVASVLNAVAQSLAIEQSSQQSDVAQVA